MTLRFNYVAKKGYVIAETRNFIQDIVANELNVMVVQEESDLEEELVQAEAIPSVEISLNYVVGLTNPKTLRARVSVGEQPLRF